MTSSRWDEIPGHLKSRVAGGTGGRLIGAKPKPKRKKGKRGPSEGEVAFANQVHLLGLPPPVAEYKFHATRRWRFDFAWPSIKLAVEIEGAIYQQGRHTRGSGFAADTVKYNTATLDGWRVLRFPTDRALNGEAAQIVAGAIRQWSK